MSTTASGSDHDILVELVTTQKLNHQAVLKEISGVQSDIKEVKNGISSQIAEHHLRIQVLESFIQTRATENKIKEWDEATVWVRDFKRTYLMVTGFIGLVGTVIGYFMNNLLNWITAKGT